VGADYSLSGVLVLGAYVIPVPLRSFHILVPYHSPAMPVDPPAELASTGFQTCSYRVLRHYVALGIIQG
jgi:hypothetical protein